MFKDRMCETLVVPSKEIVMKEDEDMELREEFLDDLRRLEMKLNIMIGKKGEKKIGNVPMNPENFIHATQIYVKNFNKAITEGDMPKITNITSQLVDMQTSSLRSNFQEALSNYKNELMSRIAKLDGPELKKMELKVVEKID